MRRYWGTSPIGSRRTKPPISTPDAGVTGARGSGGHGRAATRRRAKRDRQVSRADGPSDARNNAEAAAPVTGRDTRSEEVHCLRIGCSAPNHKNKRGICEMIADTHKAPRARAPGASAHSDQPTLHVAPSRPSVTVTPAAARRSRSSSARAQSLAARAAARSDSTARTSASSAECSAAAAPDAPAPMPAWPRELGNTLTGTAGRVQLSVYPSSCLKGLMHDE